MRIGSIEFVLSLKDNFTRVLNKAKSKAKTTASSVSSYFKKSSLAIKAAWVAVGYVVVKVFKSIISSTMAAEQAMARLVQQLKNQGIYTERNVESFKKLANQLQGLTGISNDEIVSTIALAASYKLNAKQLQEVLPSLLDLGAFTAKATGAQRDLESTVILMGYALKGAVGRMELMGITFTDVQKEMLKTGDRAQRLNVFMKAVADNAGGVAEAMGVTATGQIEIFKQSLADLGKEIGSVMLPILAKWATSIKNAITDFKIGVAVIVAWSRKAKIAVEAIFTKKTWAEAKKEMEIIDKALEEIVYEIKGLGELIFDETESAGEGVSNLAEEFKKLKKNTAEYNKAVDDLDLMLKAGIITQEIYNSKLRETRNIYGDEIAQIDKLNAAREKSITKANEYVNRISEIYGAMGSAALSRVEGGTIFEDIKKRILEQQGLSPEEIDAEIERLREAGYNIVSAVTEGMEKAATEEKKEKSKAAAEMETLVTKAGEFTAVLATGKEQRKIFLQDINNMNVAVGNLVQFLKDAQTELDNLNAKTISPKSATWTIHLIIYKETIYV